MTDECICAEWDGKGYSTCGYPCHEHFKGDKEKWLRQRVEDIARIEKVIKQAKNDKMIGKPVRELNF